MGLQDDRLAEFDRAHIGLSKGALSLTLILTHSAASKTFPLTKDEYRTAVRTAVNGG